MSERALKRIQRELAAILDDPPPGCSLLQMGDDLFRWKVEVQGPPDSPFEGGTFTLLVIFPKTYPFQPPKVKFETRIFHPNINQSGDICLDTLAAQWVPSMSMAQVSEFGKSGFSVSFLGFAEHYSAPLKPQPQ